MPARLPRGKHGLSPQFVATNQRGRLIAATVTVVAEKGYCRGDGGRHPRALGGLS